MDHQGLRRMSLAGIVRVVCRRGVWTSTRVPLASPRACFVLTGASAP